tara:strand:- start:107 stop:412 length:306 start_codon:yes stop_codon:yes gene_type:complete
MSVLFISMVLSASPDVPETSDVLEPIEARIEEPVEASEDVKKCEEGVKGLKNGVLGLEFYLQDKKLHERACPNLEWVQPSLEIYKENPKSYLPKECPRDLI